MKLATWTKRLLLPLAVFLGIAVCLGGQRGLPMSDGILNFGRVNATLYRGAQPDDAAIVHLKALGIKTIISLRTAKEASPTEPFRAVACGIFYTNMPLAGFGRPTDDEVAKILSLIQTSPGPVFVHCTHGCDRTGTIIACYRMQHDHWSIDEAMQEANRYGMSRFERGMRSFVVDFSKSLNGKNVQSAAASP